MLIWWTPVLWRSVGDLIGAPHSSPMMCLFIHMGVSASMELRVMCCLRRCTAVP